MEERVLIIGGAGFIGSKICAELIKRNINVAVFDNFTQYSDPLYVNYSEVLSYRKQLIQGANVYSGDATVIFDLMKVIREYKPTRIIHLAAVTRADINDDNILNAVQKSIGTLLNVIELYRDNLSGLKRLMYVSSSYVYGDFLYSPCDENHIKEPTSTYGGVKYSCEILTSSWCKRFSIPYTIIRPIAAYGPGDLNGKLSMQNIKKALDNLELYVMGELDELSDYTYVDDLANGMITALFADNAEGEVFNLSSGKGTSVADVLEVFKEKGYDVKAILAPKLKSRPRRGFLAINKAKEYLLYNPKTSFKEGLSNCIEYIENNNIYV